MTYRTLVSALFMVTVVHGVAEGQDVFPVGAESKMAGLESAVMVQGAPAVALNPAAINVRDTVGSRPYAEIGYGAIAASYEHPDFDPVVVNVMTPLASLGHTHGFSNENLAVGLLVYPVKSGEVAVPGLPRDLAGEMRAVEVSSGETKIRAGLGFSHVAHSQLRWGAGLIHTMEQRLASASKLGSQATLVELDAQQNNTRLTAGILADWGQATVGFSFLSGGVNTYEGKQRGFADDGYVNPKLTTYDPATTRLGVAWTEGVWNVLGHVNHRHWTPARTLLKDGLTSEVAGADVHDTAELGLTLGYAFSPRDHFTAGVAYLPTQWGDGSSGERPVMGVDFGMLDGTDRRSAALGWRRSGETFNVSCALQNLRGQREVSGGGAHVGYYQTQMTLFVSGLDFQL